MTTLAEVNYHLRNIITKSGYTCLRGPRPSAAMLITKKGEAMRGQVVPPPNLPSCKDEGECMMEDGHCVRNNHAEVDALLRAARIGLVAEGGTMVTINKPCYQCARACAAAGITHIYYAHAVYDEERTNAVLRNAGITHAQVDPWDES